MSWKDRDTLRVRAIVGVLRSELRARALVRELRQISPLNVAASIFAVFALAFHSWILSVGCVGVLVLNLSQWLYFRRYLSRAGLEDVDEMTGWEFEKWLARLFEGLGFKVERTPYRGDFGADFVLTWRNGVRIAVQAKRSARPIGVRAVQEVVAARAFYDCDQAMVVTNDYFTEHAVLLAHKNAVRMRSRDDLAKGAAGLGGAAAVAN